MVRDHLDKRRIEKVKMLLEVHFPVNLSNYPQVRNTISMSDIDKHNNTNQDSSRNSKGKQSTIYQREQIKLQKLRDKQQKEIQQMLENEKKLQEMQLKNSQLKEKEMEKQKKRDQAR